MEIILYILIFLHNATLPCLFVGLTTVGQVNIIIQMTTYNQTLRGQIDGWLIKLDSRSVGRDYWSEGQVKLFWNLCSL